jgi:hypothetical protein
MCRPIGAIDYIEAIGITTIIVSSLMVAYVLTWM